VLTVRTATSHPKSREQKQHTAIYFCGSLQMDVQVLVRFGVMGTWANMENKKKRTHFSLVSSQVRRETKK
jgi:hypothetical protein